MGDGAAKFDLEPNILTVEHVLPQTVKPGPEWEKLWPDTAVREQRLNRIASLVPLTGKKNSEAQNYDFEKIIVEKAMSSDTGKSRSITKGRISILPHSGMQATGTA